ncbi:MAG TPA: 30S ribosomal protein S20 [Cyanobacteria bacterium UBA8156]|jgi:small subunit ribosomal protein S20|nr:30S ribosomal protein S20 [Cyanobacteria bacterium UBA8156]
MANIKSAAKRAEVAERNRQRNKSHKSAIGTLMKKYFGAVSEYAANPTPEALAAAQDRMNLAYSKIDKAVKKGILHRNTGDRRKARLAAALKQAAAPAA